MQNLTEGEKIDKIKAHLKRNWGKYALGAAAAYTVKKGNDLYNSPELFKKINKSIQDNPNYSKEFKDYIQKDVDRGYSLRDNRRTVKELNKIKPD